MAANEQFIKNYYRRYMAQYSYDRPLNYGHKKVNALVVNAGQVEFLFFEGYYDPCRHDVMIAYNALPTGDYYVVIFSTKPEIDCSKIAREFGGDGCTQAANFTGPLPENLRND